MEIDLSEKTAIVTGSTGGIGFAIAKRLAQAGAAVESDRPCSVDRSGPAQKR
jgi:NAD(P)-dependent dehydrogenase (short-subunit alcohol dehydrogenase family)